MWAGAVKPLVVREGKAKNSKKADVADLPPGTLLRKMDEGRLEDGTLRMCVCHNRTLAEVIGWVTAAKEGDDQPNLEAAPTITATFNLQLHTAAAVSRALEKKLALAGTRTRQAALLPPRTIQRCALTRPAPLGHLSLSLVRVCGYR